MGPPFGRILSVGHQGSLVVTVAFHGAIVTIHPHYSFWSQPALQQRQKHTIWWQITWIHPRATLRWATILGPIVLLANLHPIIRRLATFALKLTATISSENIKISFLRMTPKTLVQSIIFVMPLLSSPALRIVTLPVHAPFHLSIQYGKTISSLS